MKLTSAEWRGPVPGMRPGGLEHPAWGVVLHIMGGSMSAADGWFHNPQSQVSAHFGVANDGHLVQWVDTDDRAWAEGAGNPNYYSIETEGSGGPLTDAQVQTCARLYAELARMDGFPFQLAEAPGEHGFGWHGMGGAAWGGHDYCPGPERKAQRQHILDLAQGHQPQPVQEDNVQFIFNDGSNQYIGDGVHKNVVHDGATLKLYLRTLNLTDLGRLAQSDIEAMKSA